MIGWWKLYRQTTTAVMKTERPSEELLYMKQAESWANDSRRAVRYQLPLPANDVRSDTTCWQDSPLSRTVHPEAWSGTTLFPISWKYFFDIVDIYRQECSSKDSWDNSTSSDMFWFVDCEYGNQNEVPVTHYWRTVHSFEVVRVSTMLTFRGLIAGEGFVSASKAFRQMSHRCSHERWLHFDFMASFQANPT